MIRNISRNDFAVHLQLCATHMLEMSIKQHAHSPSHFEYFLRRNVPQRRPNQNLTFGLPREVVMCHPPLWTCSRSQSRPQACWRRPAWRRLRFRVVWLVSSILRMTFWDLRCYLPSIDDRSRLSSFHTLFIHREIARARYGIIFDKSRVRSFESSAPLQKYPNWFYLDFN